MSLTAYTELLQTFGQSIGLPDAAPDAEGYCAMSFDELIVHFQYADEELTLFARLGEADEDRAEGIYGMLLAANLFWQGAKGATLSVEPDSRIVFVADRRPIGQLNDATFQDWLGGFVNIAEYWQKRLDTANAGGPLVDDEADDVAGTESSPMTRV